MPTSSIVPDEAADHSSQKPLSHHPEAQLVPLSPPLGFEDRAFGRLVGTAGESEGREIVPPPQSHCRRLQRAVVDPGSAAHGKPRVERREDLRRHESVAILLGRRVLAGVESSGHPARRQDPYVGREVSIRRRHEPAGGKVALVVEMRDLPAGVDPGVGPPRSMNRDPMPESPSPAPPRPPAARRERWSAAANRRSRCPGRRSSAHRPCTPPP